jgi:lipopolysaccharide transport system ATP-binding protein
MTDRAILIEGLGKKYQLGAAPERYKTLRDALADAALKPIRAARSLLRKDRTGIKSRDDSFWALRDVDFEVKRGEVVGIIGRNGAGKSTLLKILSRITEPTRGRATIHGRVGSLLEVGSGFHPELTGRENIYLNGIILGMRRAEIVRKFDEIVDFAEVEKFIDTPVKHYSSGMHLRLAFAVAAHLEPEILFVDEVLAVGDAMFQKKCLGKLGDVASHGRTVLFVSHNMGALARLCNSCLWLEQGKVRGAGLSSEIIPQYLSCGFEASAEWRRNPAETTADREFSFLRVAISGGQIQRALFDGDEPVSVEIEYRVTQPLSACAIGVRVYSAEGVVLFTTGDADHLRVAALPKSPGEYQCRFTIPGNLLAPGAYHLSIAAHAPHRHMYENLDQPVTFEISAVGSLTSIEGRQGLFAPFIPWETSMTAAAGGRTVVESAGQVPSSST